jgi:hypothetical protein
MKGKSLKYTNGSWDWMVDVCSVFCWDKSTQCKIASRSKAKREGPFGGVFIREIGSFRRRAILNPSAYNREIQQNISEGTVAVLS